MGKNPGVSISSFQPGVCISALIYKLQHNILNCNLHCLYSKDFTNITYIKIK